MSYYVDTSVQPKVFKEVRLRPDDSPTTPHVLPEAIAILDVFYAWYSDLRKWRIEESRGPFLGDLSHRLGRIL